MAGIAAVVLLVASWLIFVFGDSQVAYVVALLASASLAATLAARRAQLVVLLIVVEFALLGPEANGTLASGDAPLGSLRLVDATVAAAVAAVGVSWLRSPGLTARMRVELGRLRVDPVAGLGLGAIVWAIGLWTVNGMPLDGPAKADVRLVFLGVSCLILAASCRAPPRVPLAAGLASVGLLLAAKSAAIYFTEFFTIGNSDRLQAALVGTADDPRVILIGGDSLLLLVPALSIVAATSRRTGDRIAWPALFGSSAIVAILMSGTRTGLIVALALALGVAMALRNSLPRIRRKAAVAVAGTAVVMLTAGVFATGLATRFTTADAAGVGLNFRQDEIRSFLDLPQEDILLGQGFGGRFVGKDVTGQPGVTGWSHALPLWLMLKGGVLFAIAAVAVIGLVGRCTLRRFQTRTGDREALLVGATLLVGLLAMSFTLGRAALPEGVVLISLGLALTYVAPSRIPV